MGGKQYCRGPRCDVSFRVLEHSKDSSAPFLLVLHTVPLGSDPDIGVHFVLIVVATMMIFPSPTALIFLCFILVCLVHCYDFNGALELAHDLRLRTLKAAAHEADIAKRGSDIPFQRDVLLHYIDVCR